MNITKLMCVKFGRHVVTMCVLLLLSLSQAAVADIYSYVDSSGTVWLTNGSVNGKKNVKLLKRTPKKKQTALPLANKGSGKVSCGSHKRIAKKTKPYLGTIRKYARTYGVEENLVRALIRQESCFNAKARSHAGAEGLMQLMPGTARLMGVKNSMSPKQNIRGGVKYLSKMLRRYGGNKKLALAAYNAGPGAVDRYNGIPPYRETQNYVVKVLREYNRLAARNVHSQPVQMATPQNQNFARSGSQKVEFTSYKDGDTTVFKAVENW